MNASHERILTRIAGLVFGKLDWSRALFIIVRDMIDPCAHGIAPHLRGIGGLQQVGCSSHIFHTGIEPQVVAVWIEDDAHAVVDG